MIDFISYFSGTVIMVPIVFSVFLLSLLWPRRDVAAVAVGAGVAAKHVMMHAFTGDGQLSPGSVLGAGGACGLWAWFGSLVGRKISAEGRT